MISNGFLPKIALQQIWRSYSPAIYPTLIELLSMFLIIHPITMPDGNEGFLVPWYSMLSYLLLKN